MTKYVLLLAMLLMLGPIQPAMGALEGGAAGDDGSPDGEGVLLHLKAGVFDPVREPAPVPSWLRATSTHPHYVVQFDGPVMPEWRRSAEALGVELLEYLPDNGFFASVPAGSLDDLSDLDHVRYVGPAHPGYRMHPSLWEGVLEGKVAELEMLTWSPDGAEDLARALLERGASVSLPDRDHLTARASLTLAAYLLGVEGLGVRWVEPSYPLEPLNDNAARVSHARQASDGDYVPTGISMWSYDPSSDTFEGYPGSDVIIAVADTGLDKSHPAFAGKLVEYYDYGGDGEEDTDGHGTHVAGTALGSGDWRAGDVGTDGKYAGVAPAAKLVVQEVFVGGASTYDLGRDAAKDGASISSNSWISGWFGDYNNQCAIYDGMTRDANDDQAGDQPILYVFGAGNDGRQGAGTIRPPSLAKNVLSVGSTGNDKWGASSSYVSDFSSRGPVEDGRIKPDVLMPGNWVASARSSYPGAHSGWPRPVDGGTSYVFGTGTSMSTPGAAGAAAVVMDYHEHVHGATPSPALVKALLINGATPLPDYEYPGMEQGWGRVDLQRSLLETEGYHIEWVDQEVSLSKDAGEDRETYWFMVEDNTRLKMSLVWSDVPGNPSSSKHLVNDLDLLVTSPGGEVYRGNNFEDGESVANASSPADRVNNVEGLLVGEPEEGLWKVEVSAHDVPEGDQDFALVVSGSVEMGHIDVDVRYLRASVDDAEEYSRVDLEARVGNLGNRDAPSPTYVLDRRGPDGGAWEVVDSGTLEDLGPLQERDLSWSVTGKRGTHTFRLRVDQGNAIVESDEENNRLTLAYFFKGYDVALSSPASSIDVDPGELLGLQLSLANEGNVVDELALEVSDPPPGWMAQLTAGSRTVQPGEVAIVRLEVAVPQNATAGELAHLSLSLASTGNSTKTDALELRLEVNQVYGLEVASLMGVQEVLPGEEAELTMTVRNTGNGLDAMLITLPNDLPGGWWAVTQQPVVEVPLRSEEEVTLVLTAPDPAVAGTSVEFSVTVTSSSPDLSRQLEFSARVVQFYDSRLEVIDRRLKGDAGERMVIPLRVVNRGNGPVMYNGDINLPGASWSGGLDIEELRVGPYGDSRANLTFKIPGDALHDSYDFTMVVLSSGGEQLFDNFTFTVRQFHGVTVEVVGDVPTVTQGMTATVTLRVSNNGNGLETVEMRGDPPATWTYGFSPAVLEMEPFSEEDVTLSLDTEVNSPSDVYRVDLFALYGGSADLRADSAASVNVITRPDLVVPEGGLNLSDGSPTVDSPVRLTVTVVNEGETLAREVYVHLLVDGLTYGEPQYISSIDPGDHEDVTFIWSTGAGGLHELEAQVDREDSVDEVHEGNNEASVTVDVQPLDLKTSPGPSALLVALAAVVAATLHVVRRHQR